MRWLALCIVLRLCLSVKWKVIGGGGSAAAAAAAAGGGDIARSTVACLPAKVKISLNGMTEMGDVINSR